MNWIDIAWSSAIAACLTLSLIHLLVGFRLRGRARLAHICLALSALAVAVTGGFELSLLRVETVERYRALMYGAQFAIGVMFVALTGFVRYYFGGRLRLAATVLALSVLTVTVNVLVPPHFRIRYAESIRTVETFGGAEFTFGRIVSGPLTWLEIAATILLIIFIVQASLCAWRAGRRRQAVLIGGGIVFFLVISRAYAAAVEYGFVDTPYFFIFPFLLLLAAMGHELSLDVIRSAELSQQLAHLSRISIMGELAGTLAHELNQPLAAILNNAQTARCLLDAPGADPDQLREMMDDIIQDDKRAADVIRRLRAMLQQQASPTGDERIDVNECVRDVARLLSAEAAACSVVLVLDLASGLPPVRAGRIELQQILLNLGVNGMDALCDMPPAARRLTVSTLKKGDAVLVVVSDSGPGIPPEHMTNIFRPFFTTKQQGLGMGLAISRSLAEQIEGSLDAENRTGGGGVFTVTLRSAGREAAV